MNLTINLKLTGVENYLYSSIDRRNREAIRLIFVYSCPGTEVDYFDFDSFDRESKIQILGSGFIHDIIKDFMKKYKSYYDDDLTRDAEEALKNFESELQKDEELWLLYLSTK